MYVYPSQQHLRIVQFSINLNPSHPKSHQNPSCHPPLSTPPEMLKKFLHPKTHLFSASQQYNLKKKTMLSDGLPHGTSQIAFRFSFWSVAPKASQSSSVCPGNQQLQGIRIRFYREESCLEMFTIKKNWGLWFCESMLASLTELRKKNGSLLSMESWLFNRDPYNGV